MNDFNQTDLRNLLNPEPHDAQRDAALALGRIVTRVLMALSPQAALLVRSYAEDELTRLNYEQGERSYAVKTLIVAAIEGQG
ncbi:MAG: hypothetical protein ACK41P_04915 [Asticcacaulis sp.]